MIGFPCIAETAEEFRRKFTALQNVLGISTAIQCIVQTLTIRSKLTVPLKR